LGLLLSQPAQAGVALLYHHVDSTTPAITSIDPDQFERHLDILTEEGFRIVSLDELLREARESDQHAKIVAITFDDAYRSIYTTAYPMLKARNWPFTIFVASEYVKEASNLYLSWSELREMSENGAHIAGHTHDHTHLVRKLAMESHETWQQRVTQSIQQGQQDLLEQGFETPYFAYPYGEYNLELLGIVAGLGLTGFGQHSGAIGPYSHTQLLPRFPLAGIYVGEASFRDKINSLAMPISLPLVEPLLARDYRPALMLAFKDSSLDTSRLSCYGPGGLLPIAERDDGILIVTPTDAVSTGRSRYNCTLPVGERFYWFSQLWMRKQPDGSWYPEP
jgi:biofilm PGA synthesis lipoprotein PgaB